MTACNITISMTILMWHAPAMEGVSLPLLVSTCRTAHPRSRAMKSALVLLQMQLTLSVASIVACFVYMPKHPLDAQAPVLQARPQFVLLCSGTEQLILRCPASAAVIVTLGCCRLVPYTLR